MIMNLTQGQSLSRSNLTVCQFNLNSIAAHNFSKIYLLKTNLTFHKTDIVRFSDTYLDSKFPVNDEKLFIQGRNLVG